MAPCLCSLTPLPSPPSSSTFISKPSTIKHLQIIHSQLIKTGLIKQPTSSSRLLSFSATFPNSDLNYTLTLFHQIQNPNLFTWNTIIRAFSKSSNPIIAISLFIEMLLHSSVEPERRTYPSVFKAFSELGLAKNGGDQLHGRVIKLGLQFDGYIRNGIVHMYANCGCFGEAFNLFKNGEDVDIVGWNSMILSLAKFGRVEVARQLFDEMPERSSVSWNSMMSGYVRSGRWADALRLFGAMQRERVEADEFTVVSLLNACANLAALSQGEWVHDYVVKNGIEMNAIVTTAIVNMYCKCGSIEKAWEVFESSRVITGLSCWNSMIMGLATNGRENEAIELFSRLESSESGFNPDRVTFIGVLMACSHSGLVKKAEYYFSLMTEKYDIKPSIKHYGCMVDVLGRAGLLKEAKMVIKSMPMKPDVVIWGSFLSSCRSYGDVEMGEWGSRNLVDLGLDDETCGHVLLSNVYAGEGDFEMAIRERMLMKEKGMEKNPGCSLIEVNGEVHEFVAGGTLHREVREIRSLLENLTLKVRDISFHNHGF